MMETTKTTARHFVVFKREAEKWIGRLGLRDWRINFYHGECPDGGDPLAWYACKVCNRVGEIGLTVNWAPHVVTDRRVRLRAFHEVCHFLLATLEGIAVRREFIDMELDREVHIVIRRLENLFFGKVKMR